MIERVFVEQSGEKNKKNVFDKKSGALLKTVSIDVTYPYPYGYILDTAAADGDQLDCYIITDKKYAAESIVECEAVGMVEWFEDNEEDHKILMAPSANGCEITPEVRSRIIDFAEHFFDDRPDKKYRLGNFYGVDKAIELITNSRTRNFKVEP